MLNFEIEIQGNFCTLYQIHVQSILLYIVKISNHFFLSHKLQSCISNFCDLKKCVSHLHILSKHQAHYVDFLVHYFFK